MKLQTHRKIGFGEGAHLQSWDILEGEVWGPGPADMVYQSVGPKAWADNSPYFQPSELKCKGSGVLLVYLPMLRAYNALRHEGLLRPHSPNSFYRSPEHNKNVGGSKRSRHMFSAVDIPKRAIPDVEAMLKRAAQLGFNGFGWYPSFIHMDFRKMPAVFPRRMRSSFPNWD